MEHDAESLRLEENIDGVGTVIFEWDRSYYVVAYDETETRFRKEFELDERSYNALFALIDQLTPEELLQ